MFTKAILYGSSGIMALIGVYFGIISLLSGWDFASDQFFQFWYFIITLATGFGIQLGLYVYLKSIVHESDKSGRVLAVSGTTSTGAMISCCAHYLANILPILGVAGLASIISQYQIKLFWIGIVFNIAGVIYIARKVIIFRQK